MSPKIQTRHKEFHNHFTAGKRTPCQQWVLQLVRVKRLGWHSRLCTIGPDCKTEVAIKLLGIDL